MYIKNVQRHATELARNQKQKQKQSTHSLAARLYWIYFFLFHPLCMRARAPLPVVGCLASVYSTMYTIYDFDSFRFLDFIISDFYSFAVRIVCFHCSVAVRSFIIYIEFCVFQKEENVLRTSCSTIICARIMPA